MKDYPKRILTLQEQIDSYKDAGMLIESEEEVKEALTTIGYYRLRGYCYQLYDNKSKTYMAGTKFSAIYRMYQFDMKLSHLLFAMTSKTEVALRVRLTEALLVHGDSLILMDPTAFSDKKIYWQNLSSISAEINRSNDVFIKHNYIHHDGKIPLWAAVEIMSFGTLSKVIKNLRTGKKGETYKKLAENYKYISAKGNEVSPSLKMLSSWIHATVILRNLCAHNSRIYSRTINTMPEIPDVDKIVPISGHCGLYQMVLAMKYLRPTDAEWKMFVEELKKLLDDYKDIIQLKEMNFPHDWEGHLCIAE